MHFARARSHWDFAIERAGAGGGEFQPRALHPHAPARRFRIARIEQPGAVAAEQRQRELEHAPHHRVEVGRLLDRLVDLIHALEETQVGLQQRLDALARLALAQHQDAEGEVGGELLEQADFLGGEGVALAGVDAERAEHAARFILERQGDAGAVTALERLVAPRRDARVELVVLDPDDLAGADRRADRSAPAFDVGPGDARGVDIAEIVAGARDGTHRPFGVALDVADPGHAVARFFADDAADFGQQVRLVDRPHQRLVAGCDGAQLAIEALERRLWALASGLLAAEVEHALAFPSSPMWRVRPAIDGAGRGGGVLTGGDDSGLQPE